MELSEKPQSVSEFRSLLLVAERRTTTLVSPS
jgi:hypothetical protein